MAEFKLGEEQVAKANGINTADEWHKITPAKRQDMMRAFKQGSGKTVKQVSAENSMQNLVDKGKMTAEEKDKRIENGAKAESKTDIGTKMIQGDIKKEEKKPIPEIEKPKPIEPEPTPTEITDEEKTDSINQLSGMGITEESEPDDAYKAFLDKAVSLGLIEMDKDGKWKARQYDSKIGSAMRGIGTALSILLTIASGGVARPINFYNVRSDNDAQAKKNHDELLDNFYEVVKKFEGTELGSEYSKAGGAEKAKEAEKVLDAGKERSAELQKDTIMLNFDNQKEMAEFQNNLTKGLAQLQNELGKDRAKFDADIMAENVIRKLRAFKNSGFTTDDIARLIKAESGITGADDAIRKASDIASPVLNAVGTAAGVAAKSDRRFKKFKASYPKHEYIKR